MPLMNLSVELLIFEDQRPTSPLVRTPDITREYQKVSVHSPRSEEIVLQPGETRTIAATARALTADGTTELQVLRPRASEDVIRLLYTGTGTAAGFRTKRNLTTNAATSVSITRIAPNTVRVTGAAPFSTAAVSVGDFLKFERTTDAFTSLFSIANQGQYFKVQSKGSNYIDILDNGSASLDTAIVLGADFDQQLRVFSPGPVRVGDTVQLSGAINIGNVGKWTVSDLSSDYVEFVNPYAVAETFVNTSNLVIYDRLIGMLFVRGSAGLTLRLNGGGDIKLGTVNGEALFLGSVEAHTVEAVNDGACAIVIPLVQASVG